MRLASRILVAGLLLAVSACAHRPAAVPEAGQPQPLDSVTLNVTNHCPLPVHVFAHGSGISYRAGRVGPETDSRFVLRLAWFVAGPVEFVSQPCGARSAQLQLRPGDVVDFVIERNPVGSTATVRP